MFKKPAYLGFLLIFIFAITSCRLPHSFPKNVECPQPQQNCTPSEWRGVPYDTSYDTRRYLDFYYVFEPVLQINSPNDEWNLSFLPDKRAAITFTDQDRQRVMLVRMLRENRGSIESGIGIPFNGHTGTLSVKKNQAIFAGVSADGLMGNSNLYSAYMKDNMLVNVQPLDEVINQDITTWESHPALSPDGDCLFYISDRRGGIGGTDIYFSLQLPGGKWSAPFNCGEVINSQCDELTPFISEDGKILLFASAGHETIGGYDIFSSIISDAFWQAVKNKNYQALKDTKNFFSSPKNLRPPLNTKFDELFPSCPGDCDSILYYSSNQLAEESSLILRQGGFDIFVRRKVIPITPTKTGKGKIAEGFAPDVEDVYDNTNPQINISPKFILEGTVYNAKTKNPLPNADVTVKEMPNMNIYKETTSDAKGHYEVELYKDKQYDISAQATDLFFDSFSLRVEKFDTASRIRMNFYIPELFTLRINFPTDKFDEPYTYILDSNGVETNRTWTEELNLIAQNILDSKDYLKKLILVGHTDDVASEQYNKQLGQRRVNFIISELEKRGIPRELLEGRSAGELEPLPIRQPIEDLEIYRKRLRRVELQKILNK